MGEDEKGGDMKACKCVHWEVCPACKPEWFDSYGNRLPPEPTPLQKANGRIEELEQQLADLIQTSFDLCPKCGWRTMIPEEGCIKCQLVERDRQIEMLRDALKITHELYVQSSTGYGFARPDNPHNFFPDLDCCSKEEIEAHSKACDDYAAGRNLLNCSWGIGTYCDEYVPAIKALAATEPKP